MDMNNILDKIKNNKALVIAAGAIVAVITMLVLPKLVAVLVGFGIAVAVFNWDKIKGPAKACYAKGEAAVKAYIAKKNAASHQDTEEDTNL